MLDERLTFEIGADTRGIEAAFNRLEKSAGSLANKLDKGFGLLDVRIGLLRQGLVSVENQFNKSGNLFSKILKNMGAVTGIGALEETGKILSDFTKESAQAERNIGKFSRMEPRALLKAFKGLVSQAATLRDATKGGLSVFGTGEDIASITAAQEQLVLGLIKLTEARQNEFQKAIDRETIFTRQLPTLGPESSLQSVRSRRLLEETLQTLRDIATISDDPRIKSLIGDLDSKGSLQRQRGGLEPRSPREVQLASSETGIGLATDRLAESAGRVDRALSQQADTLRSLDSAARDLGFTFASSFEDAVVEGRNLSDVLQGLEQDILRILTRKLVTEPLAGALTGLIGSGIGVFSGQFHGGGRVGSASVSDRVVPASLFAGAPRFAGGGMIGRVPRLAPGEVPAILHRGEIVRTPSQEAALRRNGARSGDTSIVVNIQTPNPRAFNESRGQIQAMLADAVSAGRRNR